MELMGPVAQWTTSIGEPTVHGSVTVTPTSKKLVVRLPWFGFVWKHPAAVQVTTDSGQTEVLRVVNWTLMAQISLPIVGLLTWLAFRLLGRN